MTRSAIRDRRPSLRAVIFDAGNTLIRQDYAAVAAYLATRGHRVSAARVEEAEQRARLALDRGAQPGASTESLDAAVRYMKALLGDLGVSDDAEVAALAGWRRSFNRPLGVWNQADPSAEPALRAVARAGLVAGVVSNSNGSIRSVLESTGLERYLHFVIDSAVVGVEKPDPRIFELALAAAGVAAREAVYVGDLYSVDVLGARAAGLDAVLIDPRGFWGPRDCPAAPDAAAAVRLILAGLEPGTEPPSEVRPAG